jgi:citrate lyase subunit beta/citryl-CoA lyase
MSKALSAGADAVVFDLEDAVAVNMKTKARETVLSVLAKNARIGSKVYVRINKWDGIWGREDLDGILSENIDGIMLPKAEKKTQLEEVSARLPDGMELIPLVESAKGVLNSHDLASVDKVSRIAFGAIDYTLDVGISLSNTGKELIFPRSKLVLASRSADINPPIDTVFPDISDSLGLRRDLEEGRILGMFGKLLIHPSQIADTHAVFTPSQQEIEYCRKIVSAFDQAEAQGLAAIRVDGKMVDYPVYLRAASVIDFAKQTGALSSDL